MVNDSPFLVDLGRRVRAARAARGFTLADLAVRSGVSPRFLSDLEAGRGNISVVRLSAVARALGVRIDRLLAPADRVEPDRVRIEIDLELDRVPAEDARAILRWLRERNAPAPSAEKIVLVGLRGAGKTTIGQAVAAALGVPFVELDQRIEQLAGMRLSDIFSIHGEPYYRRLEREAIERVAAEPGRAVVATGGGVVNEPDTWSMVRSVCRTVWLEASPDDHWKRVIAQGDERPMEGNPQAMLELRALLTRRSPLYALAHHRVHTSRVGLEGAVRSVIEVVAVR